MERLFSQPFGDSLHSLLAVFVLTEGGETDVAFARRTEADTWGADYACAIEHFLEELPAWCIVRSLHPEIWSIFATINFQTEFLKFFSHIASVLHIVVDGAVHYYDENEIEVGKPIQCQVAVNHIVELTAEEKAEARQQAVRRYQDEELRKLQNRTKPTKAKTETQVQPSLFDFGL